MEIKEVYIGSRKIRPTTPVYPLESIVTRQKADSAGQMYIPYGDTNWKVTIDDVVVQNGGSSYAFGGYTADTEHIVKIEPITLNYGRAKNYQWYQRTGPIKNTLIEIIQDKSYIGFADSATNTGTDFRRDEYRGCSNLINTAEEYIPDTVTTIGSYFRYYQFYGCSKITETPVEVLSNTVTTIGDFFRSFQYDGCTSITSPATEVLPNTVTTIGNDFRYYQYYGCSNITEASEEVLPNTVTSIGTYFRVNQYYNCTSLTKIKGWKDSSHGGNYYRQNQFYGCNTPKTVKVISDVGYASYSSNTLQNSYVSEVQVPTAYLSNFVNSTVYPRRSIDDSKFVGY